MKKYKKIKIALMIITILLLMVTGAYIYAIKGEKINENDKSWITKIPVAHRGLINSDIPENSMEAFKNALEKGYAIELDVQLTKDKTLIVFHDANLSRLTGDSRNVKEVNYDELKALKIKDTDETIPTLKEVLELVDNQVPIYIELKDEKEATDLAPKTYELVKDYKGRYMVMSFNPFTLQWFKDNASEVIRCQLSCDFVKDPPNNLKNYELFVLKNLLLNFISKPHVISYDLKSEDTISLDLLKGQYPIMIWGVENEEDLEMAYKKGDNITFDNILP